jgi:glycosyltransferase involved in cell wall biosynthesis
VRIAYLTDGIFPWQSGGMAKYSSNLLDGLLSQGVSCNVFAPAPNPQTSEAVLGDNFPSHMLHAVPWPKSPPLPGHYVLDNYLFSVRVAGTVDLSEYDLVLSHGLSAWRILQKRRREGVPILVHPHGLELFQPNWGFGARLRLAPLCVAFRSVLQRADGVFSFGPYFDRLLVERVGLHPSRILRTDNAVTEDFFRKAGQIITPGDDANRRFRFLFLGRDEPRKGLDLFLQAAKALPQADFHVVRIDRASVLPNVRFFGPVWSESRILSFFQESDCFILPSRAEGFPTVLLEAMACSLPVITSDLGVIRDHFPSQPFVFPIDSVHGLISKAEQVYGLRPQQRREIGLVNREMVESRYLWPQVAKRMIERFTSLRTSSQADSSIRKNAQPSA